MKLWMKCFLVKGMTQQRYDKLINYVTIYGDGAVNINTASKDVLDGLGPCRRAW